jgi:hypothetical protein
MTRLSRCTHHFIGKVLTVTLLIHAAAMLGSDAYACSIHINQVRMKNELTAEALSHLNITIDQVTHATTANYHFNVLAENPSTLCPEQMQHDLDIQVSYKPNLISQCTVSLHVTKLEHWGDTPPTSPDSFTVTGDGSRVCTPIIIRPIIRPVMPGRPIQ